MGTLPIGVRWKADAKGEPMKEHSESRMRENRLSGSMQGRREETTGTDNCGHVQSRNALARLLYCSH